MDIAIVDDESSQLKIIVDKVKAYAKKQVCPCRIATFTNGTAFLKSNQSFDLIFLDIQMPGLSGMEVAKSLRLNGVESYIVFVTVLQEYVYDAFGVEASDYLLKPVDDDRFCKMMDRICGSFGASEKRRLVVFSKGNTCNSVLLQDILYCEAANHKINICTKTQTLAFYNKMEELEHQLDERFFKCHRSYLVNLDAVCGYQDGLALLENGVKIPVSRLRVQEFSLKMLQHMKRRGC